MSQVANPVTDKVKEVFEAVVDALRVPKPEEGTPSAVFRSFEAEALREEIIRTGRKLWERQYVDGNGGNISCRIGGEYVLCTPTMISKGDIAPADICLSDMSGNIVAGNPHRTSELLLHLEIYRANPRARAIVHCHPPYATAFSLTGTPPPCGLISEYEIFIGPAALARFETPGTQAFAETVLPFVQDHNTILLANHGVVCWSDTITHAEWLVEILESYCKTCVIAGQIGKPLIPIPEPKLKEILDLKRHLGFPDARMSSSSSDVSPDVSSAEVDRHFREVVSRL
ncbi:class II aldolase/adducin family protein [Occallatibacter savannae]|uniref:class II aldolase/adducin family protein n=1 Tax=Occallatibacter savannae TaxID=1002691 RepID=UPI000D69C272|nr:class II aldolase/adducin family protein [Occallatibacter savannae]